MNQNHIVVVISLEPPPDERPVPLSQDGLTTSLIQVVKNGDLLSFVSPHGPVLVQFKGKSPFEAGGDGGGTPRKIAATPGDFPYHCGVTVLSKDGKTATVKGWPKSDQGGGTVKVDI